MVGDIHRKMDRGIHRGEDVSLGQTCYIDREWSEYA